MKLRNGMEISQYLPYVIPDSDSECESIRSSNIIGSLMPLAWTVCILTVLSNAIIVICTVHLIKKGEEPRCTYMLLGNIAVSDFLTGTIQMIEMSSLKLYYVEETRYTCLFVAGLYTTITLVSVYSVLLISVDRFLYIIHGIRYNQLVLPHKVGLLIFSVWVLGVSIGMVPLFFVNEEISKDNLCWYPLIAKPSLVIVESVLGVIPVLYVVMLYSIILYKAIKNIILIRKMIPKTLKHDNVEIKFYKGKIKQKERTIEDGNKIAVISKKTCSLEVYTVKLNDENECTKDVDKTEDTSSQIIRKMRKTAPSECKAIKVVLFTTGCFACTWVPYFIHSIMFAITNKEESIVHWCTMLIALRYASYVGTLNSFFNPFIYAWWHSRFRKSVKKLYCGRMKKFPLQQPAKVQK